MANNKGFKVTYSTLDPEGMEAFHRAYDKALKDVINQFGQMHPIFIFGKEVEAGEMFVDTSPINTKLEIGKFQRGTASELNAAVDAAFSACKSWRDTDYKERCRRID